MSSQRAKNCVGQTAISRYLQRKLSTKTAAKLRHRERIFLACHSVYQKVRKLHILVEF